jgi:poly(3-hydroxybutyrate) depolymerase
LAKQHDLGWFQRNVVHLVPSNFPGFMRRVYPGFLQHAGFISMNPGRHANSHWDYFQHLVKGDDDASVEAHREFYDEYNAVLDLDAEFYLDTIQVVFQDHLLPKGEWDVSGERVKPQDIRRTALLTIEGELDDISGPGQTQAAHALCTGIPREHKRHETIEGAGHYGIFSGRRWRTIVAPKIAAFIAQHEPSTDVSSRKRNAKS